MTEVVPSVQTVRSLILTLILFQNTNCLHWRNCTNFRQCLCSDVQSVAFSAICSGIGLDKILNFGSKIVNLSLAYNKIPNFQTSSNENLETLDLSYNSISSFSNNSCSSLTKLRELNLRHNELRFNDSTFHTDVFVGLGNLKILNLKKNAFTRNVSDRYPDKAFARLVSLEELKIDGLLVVQFGDGFRNLSKLSVLDISGKDGFCYTKILQRNSLENLPFLRVLDVSSCQLKEIQQYTLWPLNNLTTLNISFNEKLTFDVFQNISCDFPPSLKVFRADKIYCTYGRGTVLEENDVKCFKNTSIQEIHLSQNRLEMLAEYTLSYTPPTLNHVSVKDNRLLLGKYLLHINSLVNITTIIGSEQFFSHELAKDNMFVCVNKQRCLTHDAKHTLDADLDHLRSKWKRPLMTEDKPGKNNFITIHIPDSLRELYFSNFGVKGFIPPFAVSDNNSIEHINLSNNVLTSWIGPIHGLKKLRYLDISNCLCSKVTPYFFDSFKELEHLKINSNLLGYVLPDDSMGETFKSLNKLLYLDLSDNKIGDLKKNIFKGLPNLKTLCLQNNSLSEFDIDISHMKNISFIDLSTNLITSFAENVTASVDNDMRLTKFQIDLKDNPLQCTCSTLHFLKWLKSRRHNFKDFKKYLCHLSNHNTVSFGAFNQVLLQLEKECSPYIILQIGTAFAITVFVSILISTILYRYRWKLRYLYYMTRNVYNGYTPLTEESDDFRYDAFVSHATEDKDFAVTEIENHLEIDRSFKLCIAHRDFKPGTPIAANITYAINKSRKTIVILSRNYLQSYWCMYELNMARMESIYKRNGTDVFLIIMFENIPTRLLPLQIMEIINKESYIAYPNDDTEQRAFWNTLTEALST